MQGARNHSTLILKLGAQVGHINDATADTERVHLDKRGAGRQIKIICGQARHVDPCALNPCGGAHSERILSAVCIAQSECGIADICQHIIVNFIPRNRHADRDGHTHGPKSRGDGRRPCRSTDLAFITGQHIKTAGCDTAPIDRGRNAYGDLVVEPDTTACGGHTDFTSGHSDRACQSKRINALCGDRLNTHIASRRGCDDIGIGDRGGNPGRAALKVNPLPEGIVGIIERQKLDPLRITQRVRPNIAVGLTGASPTCEIDAVASADRGGRCSIRGVGGPNVIAIARPKTDNIARNSHAHGSANTCLAHGNGSGCRKHIGHDIPGAHGEDVDISTGRCEIAICDLSLCGAADQVCGKRPGTGNGNRHLTKAGGNRGREDIGVDLRLAIGQHRECAGLTQCEAGFCGNNPAGDVLDLRFHTACNLIARDRGRQRQTACCRAGGKGHRCRPCKGINLSCFTSGDIKARNGDRGPRPTRSLARDQGGGLDIDIIE